MIVILILLSCGALFGQKDIPIIPLPVQATRLDGPVFQWNASTNITYSNDSLRAAAELLDSYQFVLTKRHIPVKNESSTAAIILSIDRSAAPEQEGYWLRITGDRIELKGHDLAGIVHGISTLRQLWSPTNGLHVPSYEISDHPRFSYRGMHLDVGRHFFPVGFVKEYIDWLSLYKFNTFHWHLTEDQGWRIEIKKYPRLQSVGAWRSETLIGHKRELPHRYDGQRYGGYYTQSEIRDVVAYAAERKIDVIPEIEMPGHALAALSAYPDLGCTGGPYSSAGMWGVFDDVYCAGNDSVFTFLQDVLDEVMELFPSRLIHIGGDECPKTRWIACPKCQRRMHAEGLENEHALQSWFVRRIEKYLNSKGRQIIGWDEILEGGLAPGAAVMSWRGEEGGIAAAEQHHPVILSPESHFYFDYYQSLSAAEPLAAGGYTPLDKVYGYEPLSTVADTARRRLLLMYVRGLQGQVWTEYMTTPGKIGYMVFPRAAALAELAWSPLPEGGRTASVYAGFLQRLREQRVLWDRLHLRYADNFDEIRARTVTRRGLVLLSLSSSLPASDIRYTTDGTLPTNRSPLYKGSITLTKSCTVRARLFVDGGAVSGQGAYIQRFILHKAVGAALSYTPAPAPRFDPGGQTLLNGMTANRLYNDGQWMGWNARRVELVADLGAVILIRNIGMNLLNYHWQRMWGPATLQLFISEGGEAYHEVYRQSAFPVNGINKLRSAVARRGRYVKVVLISPGTIPAGEYGAGGQPLMLADELIIE